MTDNRIDALLTGTHDAEEEAIAKLGVLDKEFTGAESRAAEVVAKKALLGRYRYNPGLGWLAWSGRRWDSDDTAEARVIETVRQCVDTIERDYRARSTVTVAELEAVQAAVLARLTPEQRVGPRGGARTPRQLVEEHATDAERARMQRALETEPGALSQAEIWLNLLSSGKVSALVKLCRGMDGIVTRAAEFDSHPDLLNCHNGVIDLRTGELRPHDPDLLLTHIAGGGYDPSLRLPLLQQALEAIPPELREWYQVRLGQAASGHTPDDDSLILEHGKGENGKTVVLLAAMRALGSYAKLISHRVLTATSDQHPTELMDLRGLRLAVLEETPEEGRLDPHRIKMTIGTGHITARLMRKDDVTFETSHSLFITSNYWPQVDTTDHGTWRKLKGMDWPYRYLPPGEVPTRANERAGDRTIKSRVLTDPDLPTAMLTWIAEGAQKWYANGQVLPEDPQPIKDATAEWRKSCDVGYQFAVDYLIAGAGYYITSSVLKDEFNLFLTQQGKKQWSSQLLNTRFPSSLAAVGIHVDATPRSPAGIASLTESSPGNPHEREANPHDSKKTMRIWRGVRFKTDSEGVVSDGQGAQADVLPLRRARGAHSG